jgi:uncharacterized paraquat-inducible protein A
MRELEMQNGEVRDAATAVPYCPECDEKHPERENVHCPDCDTALVLVESEGE